MMGRPRKPRADEVRRLLQDREKARKDARRLDALLGTAMRFCGIDPRTVHMVVGVLSGDTQRAGEAAYDYVYEKATRRRLLQVLRTRTTWLSLFEARAARRSPDATNQSVAR